MSNVIEDNVEAAQWITVWDPYVRIAHWVMAVSFFLAWFTEDGPLDVHVWSGYVVGILVITRVIWGFVGSPHARFNDFIYGPGTVLRYLGSYVSGGSKRYIGHNPAGGAMIIALLACLAVTVWTGLELYAIEEKAGPLAGAIGNSQNNVNRVMLQLVRSAEANGDEKGKERGEGNAEEYWEELHETFSNLTLGLVILHILGVVLASRLHHENLIKSMFTGRKRP